MLIRTLAKMVAMLPASLKYKIKGVKGIYTFILGLGQSIVEIETIAGKFYWKVNQLISQRFILGTYEPYMQKAFLAFTRHGFVVYDVGAHTGFHTLFCGLLVGPSGRVIAFEPNPESYASLKQQIMLNPDLPLTILPYAISDICGYLRMNTSRGPSQSEITESGNVVVEARTIDTLVERKNIPPPQLIKFDVEGHEKQALRGAINTLTRYRPVVLCDYNDDTTLGAVSNILELLGYNIRTGPPIIAIPNKL